MEYYLKGEERVQRLRDALRAAEERAAKRGMTDNFSIWDHRDMMDEDEYPEWEFRVDLVYNYVARGASLADALKKAEISYETYARDSLRSGFSPLPEGYEG